MAMLVITRGYVAKGCGDESGATEPNSEVPGTDDYIQKKRFFDWLWTFNVGRATCTWICFTGPCNKLGGAKGVKSNFKWSWLAMVKSNQDSPSSKSTKSQRIRRCRWGINKNTAGGRWPWKNRHVPWILGSQNFGLLPALWDNFLILFDCKLKTYIYIYANLKRMGTYGHLITPRLGLFLSASIGLLVQIYWGLKGTTRMDVRAKRKVSTDEAARGFVAACGKRDVMIKCGANCTPWPSTYSYHLVSTKMNKRV